MDPKDSAPGVATPPVEPIVPTPPAPNGSEPVINSGTPNEQTVPFTRFQEVNDRAKQAEEELKTLREQQAPSTPSIGDDELDPEVEELIRKGAKKLGLVSKQELAAQNMQIQVQQDIRDLESHYSNSGIPYDHKAIMKYAESNNMPITSKASLEAAYRSMNWDTLLEAERQRTIAGIQNGNGATAERPGSSGGQPPSEPQVTGRNPKERIKSRIAQAKQRLVT